MRSFIRIATACAVAVVAAASVTPKAEDHAADMTSPASNFGAAWPMGRWQYDQAEEVTAVASVPHLDTVITGHKNTAGAAKLVARSAATGAVMWETDLAESALTIEPIMLQTEILTPRLINITSNVTGNATNSSGSSSGSSSQSGSSGANASSSSSGDGSADIEIIVTMEYHLALVVVGRSSLHFRNVTSGTSLMPSPVVFGSELFTAADAPPKTAAQLPAMVTSTIALPNGDTRTHVAVVSRLRTIVYFMTLENFNTTSQTVVVATRSSIQCPSPLAPEFSRVLHAGGSTMIAQCPTHVIRQDVAVNHSYAAVQLADVALGVWKERTSNVPVHMINASMTVADAMAMEADLAADQRPVFYAGYANMKSRVVVGIVNFSVTAPVSPQVQCGSEFLPAVLDHRIALPLTVRSILVLGAKRAAPSIVVQVGANIVTFETTADQFVAAEGLVPSAGNCSSVVAWQRTLPVVPTLGDKIWIGAVSPMILLPTRSGLDVFAMRLASQFLVIDATSNGTVVWSQVAPKISSAATASGALHAAVSLHAMRLVLSSGPTGVVVAMPGQSMNKWSTDFAWAALEENRIAATSGVPPPVIAPNAIVALRHTVNGVVPAVAVPRSQSFHLEAETGFADVNGAIVAVNPIAGNATGRTVSMFRAAAVGVDGVSVLWDRSDMSLTSYSIEDKTSAIVQPFRRYLFSAFRAFAQVSFTDALTGAHVASMTMPESCGTVTSVRLFDSDFDANSRTGEPQLASTAERLIVVTGTAELGHGCIVVFNEGLQRSFVKLPAVPITVTQVNATHLSVLDSQWAVVLVDVNPTAKASAEPVITQRIIPQIFNARGAVRRSVALCGNVVVASTATAISALLVSDGQLLWTERTASSADLFTSKPLCIGHRVAIAQTSTVSAFLLDPTSRLAPWTAAKYAVQSASTLVLSPSNVIVAVGTKSVIGISATTGAVQWSESRVNTAVITTVMRRNALLVASTTLQTLPVESGLSPVEIRVYDLSPAARGSLLLASRQELPAGEQITGVSFHNGRIVITKSVDGKQWVNRVSWPHADDNDDSIVPRGPNPASALPAAHVAVSSHFAAATPAPAAPIAISRVVPTDVNRYTIPHAVPVKSVADGSGDIIALNKLHGSRRPAVIVRRRLFGNDAGAVVWNVTIPSGATVTPFGNATAFFTAETGIVVVDDKDGSIRVVAPSVLSRGCGLMQVISAEATELIALHPGQATAANVNAPMQPPLDMEEEDLARAVLMLRVDHCLYFVSSNMTVAAFEADTDAEFTSGYGLHAKDNATSAIVVTSAQVIRLPFPKTFFASASTTDEAPALLNAAAVDHHIVANPQLRSWTTQSCVFAEDVFVVTSETMIAAVLINTLPSSGPSVQLLWQLDTAALIGGAPQLIGTPMRMYFGLLYVCVGRTVLVINPFLAAVMSPSQRVTKTIELPKHQSFPLPRDLIGGRVTLFQFHNGMRGYDVLAQEFTFHLPVDSTVDGAVSVVPVGRSAPMFSTFMTASGSIAVIRNPVTGAGMQTMQSENTPGSIAKSDVVCTGTLMSHDQSSRRCVAVLGIEYTSSTLMVIALDGASPLITPAKFTPPAPVPAVTVASDYEFRGPPPMLVPEVNAHPTIAPLVQFEVSMCGVGAAVLSFVSTEHDLAVYVDLENKLITACDMTTGFPAWKPIKVHMPSNDYAFHGAFGTHTLDRMVAVMTSTDTTRTAIQIITVSTGTLVSWSSFPRQALAKSLPFTSAVALPGNVVCVAVTANTNVSRDEGVVCVDVVGVELGSMMCAPSRDGTPNKVRMISPDPTFSRVVVVCDHSVFGINSADGSISFSVNKAQNYDTRQLCPVSLGVPTARPDTLAVVTQCVSVYTTLLGLKTHYVISVVQTEYQVVSNLTITVDTPGVVSHEAVLLNAIIPMNPSWVAIQTQVKTQMTNVAGYTAWTAPIPNTCTATRPCSSLSLASDGSTLVSAVTGADGVASVRGLRYNNGSLVWQSSNGLNYGQVLTSPYLMKHQTADGVELLISPVAILDGVTNAMILIDGITGNEMWIAQSNSGNPWAFTGSCLFADSGVCYVLKPPASILTTGDIQSVVAVSPTNFYSFNGGSVFSSVLEWYGTWSEVLTVGATPAFSLPVSSSTTFAFGPANASAPANATLAIIGVGSFYWVVDTVTLTPKTSVAFPSSNGRPQTAMLTHSVAVPTLIAGMETETTAAVPGSVGSVFFINASTVAGATTVKMAEYVTAGRVAVPLQVFVRAMRPMNGTTSSHASGKTASHNAADKTCGVIVVSGLNTVEVIDCSTRTPWWSAAAPEVFGRYEITASPVVTGNYMVVAAGPKLACISVLTGQLVWRGIAPLSPTGVCVSGATLIFTTAKFMGGFALPLDKFATTTETMVSVEPTWFGPTEMKLVWSGADRIIAQSSTAPLTCINATTGRTLWTSTIESLGCRATPTDVHEVNGTLLFTCESRLLAVAIDAPGASGASAPPVVSATTMIMTTMPLNAIYPAPQDNTVVVVGGHQGIVAPLAVKTSPLSSPNSVAPIEVPHPAVPALAGSASAAPTLPPGVVFPGPGCVSRVSTAGPAFVQCIDAIAVPLWAEATWAWTTNVSEPTPTLRRCSTAAQEIVECQKAYLNAMGPACPAGASFMEMAILPKLRATEVFGKCPAHPVVTAAPNATNTSLCAGGESETEALCKAVAAAPIVAGVPTLTPDQKVVAGFSFQHVPKFSLPAQPPQSPAPTPAPTPIPATPQPAPRPDPQYAAVFSGNVTPTAASLGKSLSALINGPGSDKPPVPLKIDSITKTVSHHHTKPAMVATDDMAAHESGTTTIVVKFTLTGPDAASTGDAIGNFPAKKIEAAIGASGFGMQVPTPTNPPVLVPVPGPPKKSSDGGAIAAAVIVTMILTAAAVGGAGFFIVWRMRQKEKSPPEAGTLQESFLDEEAATVASMDGDRDSRYPPAAADCAA